MEWILKADVRMMDQAGLKKVRRQAERAVVAGCKKHGVSLTELRNGSRWGNVRVRVEITRRLVEHYGLELAKVSR